MKLVICFLLFCALYAVASAKSTCSEEVSQKSPSSELILTQGLAMVLAKLEQMDRNLVQLHFEVNEHREEVERNRASQEKTMADLQWAVNRLDDSVKKDVGRNISLLQDQSLLILAQQRACASHEQFREKWFNFTTNDNEGQGWMQSQKGTNISFAPLYKSLMPDCVASTATPSEGEATTLATPTTFTVTETTTSPIASTTATTTPITSPAMQTPKSTATENPAPVPSTSPTMPSTTTTTPQPTTTLDPNSPSYSSCRNVPSKASGVFIIQLNNSERINVLCEQESFGGGWIVIQHRFDGSLDFYRNWNQYRDGFGELNSEFWLGLERIHQLTAARAHEIIFEMKDFEGDYGFSRYDEFQIGSEMERYNLKTLGLYSGTAGDGMDFNVFAGFSTKDRNNDNRSDTQWAVRNEGGWWYGFTGGSSNLNGRYQAPSEMKSNRWYPFKNDWNGMSFTRMMIRELEE